MPSKLFHALVVTGASITGSIGLAVIPAVALPGCDDDNKPGIADMGLIVSRDAGVVAWADMGAAADLGVGDLSEPDSDGGSDDGGP